MWSFGGRRIGDPWRGCLQEAATVVECTVGGRPLTTSHQMYHLVNSFRSHLSTQLSRPETWEQWQHFGILYKLQYMFLQINICVCCVLVLSYRHPSPSLKQNDCLVAQTVQFSAVGLQRAVSNECDTQVTLTTVDVSFVSKTFKSQLPIYVQPTCAIWVVP